MSTFKLPKDARFEIARGDELYPTSLERLENPPVMLYGYGDPKLLSEPGIAIVGPRKPSPYGVACADMLAQATADYGYTVISGGALGIDSVAHRGALRYKNTRTIAVIPGGLDYAYPSRNHDLFRRIVATGGVLVSEQNWETPPIPSFYTERNRIIAALSQAVAIPEAAIPSGTFSTYSKASKLGVPIWVCPGPITSPQSAGTNQLIAQGVTPILGESSYQGLLDTLND